MAEFCLDCFNQYVLPEGCGEMKHVVLADRPKPYWRRWFRRK